MSSPSTSTARYVPMQSHGASSSASVSSSSSSSSSSYHIVNGVIVPDSSFSNLQHFWELSDESRGVCILFFVLLATMIAFALTIMGILGTIVQCTFVEKEMTMQKSYGYYQECITMQSIPFHASIYFADGCFGPSRSSYWSYDLSRWQTKSAPFYIGRTSLTLGCVSIENSSWVGWMAYGTGYATPPPFATFQTNWQCSPFQAVSSDNTEYTFYYSISCGGNVTFGNEVFNENDSKCSTYEDLDFNPQFVSAARAFSVGSAAFGGLLFLLLIRLNYMSESKPVLQICCGLSTVAALMNIVALAQTSSKLNDDIKASNCKTDLMEGGLLVLIAIAVQAIVSIGLFFSARRNYSFYRVVRCC